MAKNNAAIVTLYGNLGDAPEVRHIPEKEIQRHVYDFESDAVVEKTFTRQARDFRTFSLAVRPKDVEEPRWFRCVDWNNQSEFFQKGDRVRVTGSFEIRTYQKDGETRRVRQFVVRTADIERAKLPQEQAA